MERLQLLLVSIIVAASVSGQPTQGAVEQIRACLRELAENNSSHIADEQLAKPWSVAWTVHYSESRLTIISIRESVPADKPDFDRLSHDWAILCTVDAGGNVVSLISPEDNGLVQYVENGELVDDRSYDQIVENLRAGKAIHRFDAYYRIAGEESLSPTRMPAR